MAIKLTAFAKVQQTILIYKCFPQKMQNCSIIHPQSNKRLWIIRDTLVKTRKPDSFIGQAQHPSGANSQRVLDLRTQTDLIIFLALHILVSFVSIFLTIYEGMKQKTKKRNACSLLSPKTTRHVSISYLTSDHLLAEML